jgi:hypothetical protein
MRPPDNVKRPGLATPGAHQTDTQSDEASLTLGDVVLVVPRDPVAAADALAAVLHGRTFAARWAKALLEALS